MSTAKYMYDLIVVGGGSGGVRAARISAGHGAKVCLIEASMKHGPPSYTAIGGTCVNVGCVPKKLMVYGSQFQGNAKLGEHYGWLGGESGKMSHVWQKMREAKDKEITRLNGAYGKILGNAPKNGGSMQVYEGLGAFGADAHTVQITKSDGTKEDITGDKIIVCVGGWPKVPDELEGKEHVITSNEVFYLEDRPKHVVIVGGGYIAVEFAGIFHGLGSEVVQMYRGPMFLRGFDDGVREHLLGEMKKHDINVQLNTNPKKVEKLPNGRLKVTTEKGDEVETDCVMYATGRVPKLDGLNLDKVGVQIGKKQQIVVNEWSQTNVDNVYAVGDCTERVNLTPVALREGHLLADMLFGGKKRQVDYDLIPSAVFSQPEIGSCGLTEQQAVEKYKDVTVYVSTFKPMKYTMVPDAKERSLFKLIVDDATEKVVGIHAVTDGAGEMIQGFAVALRAGATKADFDDTIGIHPTSAEEFVTMRTPSYSYKNGQKQAQL